MIYDTTSSAGCLFWAPLTECGKTQPDILFRPVAVSSRGRGNVKIEDLVIGFRVVFDGPAVDVIGVRMTSPGPAPADRGSVARRLKLAVSQLDRHLVELCRDIHRHPEIAGQERRTANLVARELRAAGLHVTTGVGGHGVVAILTGERPGRTVAYRADMDAVPPNCQVQGSAAVAHVCGHDVHTAVGVGIALVLARLRQWLAGTVVFVFQPAEEALTGAAAMLAEGVFAQACPTEIHALHCYALPVGQFAVMPGFGLPGQESGLITVIGSDAMARAERLATEINILGTIAAPTTSTHLERVVSDVQTPHGPLEKFVFMQARAAQAPDQPGVRVSYRCWPENRNVEIREAIRHLVQSAGGASVDFPNDSFPAVVVQRHEAQELKRYLDRTVGRDRIRVLHAAIPFAGDDFALFLDKLPGTYTLLGVRAPGAAVETAYPHFGAFKADERAIGHGVRAMAGWLATRTLVRGAAGRSELIK